MTNYPIARFVGSMSPDAATRFDFHDPFGSTTTNPATWQWTPGGLLGEPDSISPSYGLGGLSFEFQIHGTHSEALRAMAGLARELRRPRNFLLFQFDAHSPPGWLEVYPSSPGALGFPYASPGTDDSAWIIPVSLTTSGTILGEQVTHEVTVYNDPAVADGLAVTLPEITGDAPTPLIVEYPLALSCAPTLALTPFEDDAPPLQFWQAEAWTLGADATVVANALYSGGSCVGVDFATDETLTERVAGSVTTSLAGRFFLYARVVAGLSGSETITVKGGGAALVSAVTTTLDDQGGLLVPLGEYAFPSGNPPASRGYTLGAGADAVTVEASRDGATSTMAIDYIVAIQVDGIDLAAPTMMARLDLISNPVGVSSRVRFDGEHDQLDVLNLAGADWIYEPLATTGLAGSYLRGVPGVTNVLTFLPRMYVSSLGEWSDTVADPTTLTVCYRPHFVYLPGA